MIEKNTEGKKGNEIMKKMTALLLTLILACLATFACAADADPLYTGEWYMKTMSQGDQSFDVAAMGMNAVLTLNEDWTCSVTGMGADVTGTWKDENEKITAVIDGDPADLMLSNGELTLSAGDTTMVFTREAPAAATEIAEVKADAAAEEFNGEWTCVALTVGEMTLSRSVAEAAGQELPKMTFADGTITMEGGAIAESFANVKTPLTYADGTYSFAISNVSVTANILQDGKMAVTFAAGELTTGLYFEKAE